MPIHNNLLELGLADYAASLDPNGRRWPTLRADKYGKRSSAFSKWFGRYKRASGLKDPKLIFHSLRHTFVNTLKQLEVSEAVIAELVGHKNECGKRYNLPLLNKAIQSLETAPRRHLFS